MSTESNVWMVGRDHQTTQNEDGTSTTKTWVCVQLSSSRSSTILSLSQTETRKMVAALLMALDETPETPSQDGEV